MSNPLQPFPVFGDADFGAFLETWNRKIETPAFLDGDPAAFMHAFDLQADREIAAFFAALLAWGHRTIVNAKVRDLLERMNNRPFYFISSFENGSFRALAGFKHRTFNDRDMAGLMIALKHALASHGTLEPFFKRCLQISNESGTPFEAVFQSRFLEPVPEFRTRLERHITSPLKGSACKRFWLFLRWMIRKNSPVDLGCWSFLPASEVKIPLDVHVGNTARLLGLLKRKQNDAIALQELMQNLKSLDNADPARFDYALFGIGVAHFLDVDKNSNII